MERLHVRDSRFLTGKLNWAEHQSVEWYLGQKWKVSEHIPWDGLTAFGAKFSHRPWKDIIFWIR